MAENPYRKPSVGPSAGPYDPRAPGLRGEMLDSMLKAAYTEGAQDESRRLSQQWAEERPSIWDQGHAAGKADGAYEHRHRNEGSLNYTINKLRASKGRLSEAALDDLATTLEKVRDAL